MSIAEVLALSILSQRYSQRAHAYAAMGALPLADDVRTSPAHLVRLCEAAKGGGCLYPLDKLERWCGYIESMIAPLNAADFHTPLFKRLDQQEIILGFAVSGVQDLSAPVNNGRWLQELCVDLINEPIDAISHRKLGFVQGSLATVGWIDVDVERDFSRPLLHAIHNESIPTFS